jgi:hypothetical protein
VQTCLSIVTDVASGCGPVVSPKTERRLGRPTREQSSMRDLVSSSGSILVSLPLCFKLRTLHYLCTSFVTQELM